MKAVIESLPLRHAVWVAENSSGVALKIAGNPHNSSTVASNWTGESVLPNSAASFVSSFSEGQARSPVSLTPYGECNAITMNVYGRATMSEAKRQANSKVVRMALKPFVPGKNEGESEGFPA